MNRTAIALGTAATAALLLTGAPAAQAASTSFTIVEHLDFNAGTFQFTSSDPLCPSGTFTDDFVHIAAYKGHADKTNFVFDTEYVCDNGSGSFFVTKHVNISFNADGSLTNSGPIRITGGTGAYAGISGSGHDVGATTGDGIGTGVLTGLLTS